MASSYLLGSDIGTGSCKTVLLDEDGVVVASASAGYPTHYPHPDWVEQHPQDWYAAFCETTRTVLAESEVSPAAIRCVCVVGVTHNPVLLDAHGKVLRPSIHFWDQRSSEQVVEIQERWGAEVALRAHNAVDVLWTWPQLLWVRQHEPEVWQQIDKLVFPKDYVRYRLSGSLVTDFVDPAGSLLYAPEARQWVDAFVADLGLPAAALPMAVSSFDQVGTVTGTAADETGLVVGTPVIAGTTDTAAEVLGAGAVRLGQAIVKLSSVGRLMVITKAPLTGGRNLNYPHVLPGLWYPGSVTKYGAAAYDWARKALWPDYATPDVFQRMDVEAASVPAGSEGVLFLPHLLGEYSPQWNPKLRAAFVGLNVNHHRAHLTRAVLEGVAAQISMALEALKQAGAVFNEVRLIGGGASSEVWSQIMADVLGETLAIPRYRSAAYGAGLMAGLGIGMFSGADEVDKLVQIERVVVPDTSNRHTYQELITRYKVVDRLLTSAFE